MSDDFEDFDKLDQTEEETVGLRAEDKKHANSNQLEWFRGEKGQAYRLSFVYFDTLAISVARQAQKRAKEAEKVLTKEQLIEFAKKALAARAAELKKSVDELQLHEKLDLSESLFKKLKFQYKENFGYSISRLGLDGVEADKVWNLLGPPKTTFTTVIVKYPTLRGSGELDKTHLATHWDCLPWRLSTKTYGALHSQAGTLRSNDISIAGQDLVVTCTNTEYQNFDKMEAAGKAAWRMNDKFRDMVLAKAVTLYDKLIPFRTLSTADLRAKLGGDVGASSGGGSGKSDVSSSEIDEMLATI